MGKLVDSLLQKAIGTPCRPRERAVITSGQKTLLTRKDLPIDQVIEICRRWNLVELAIDTSQRRPPADAAHTSDGDPFAAVDLYLIADFGPGKYEWGFKKNHSVVVKELQELLGSNVWIEDKGILEKHIASGAEWARQEKESRDVIYAVE